MIANREDKLNDNEYQVLVGDHLLIIGDHLPMAPQDFKRHKRPRNDYSSFECYACHKMGHIAINCPHKKYQFKNKKQKYDAHVVE